MIPLRVSLRGFLSYRDEQEVRFDGSSLWILSGLNGSGKSTVFDGVTYALFGQHRGGHQHAHELINADSDGAAIEFDFTQDGRPYRVRRTLKRKVGGGATGTQQILSWQPDEATDDTGRWVPIEGTGRRTEFEEWVRDHIGLNYETFTSSILLLQGKAEKLLDSTAKGRFEVLAGIVDLERYQRLHEKADGQRKVKRGQVEGLKKQLEVMPEVTELELVAVQNRIDEAEAVRQRAQAELERWQGLEFQARRWAELQVKRLGLHQRWQKAQALVAQAEAIEKDLARLRELEAVLPHVETAIKQRHQAQEASDRIDQLQHEAQELDAQIDERRQAAEQSRLKRGDLQKKLAADEQHLSEVANELRRLEGVLAQVRQHERQQQVLAQQQAELAQLPADAPQVLERLQALHDQVVGLTQALPLLERLSTQRDQLRQAMAGEKARTLKDKNLRRQGEKIRNERNALEKQLETATQARQQAEQDLAADQALARQLEENWQAFLKLEGARTCRQCGQPLTPKHFETEKARREKEREQARSRCQAAEDKRRPALEKEQGLREQFVEVERRLEQAREEYRTVHAAVEQVQRDIERHRTECAAAWSDLPETLRLRVSAASTVDWLTTTYPEPADLEEGRREAQGLAVVRRQLRDAQEVHTRWRALQAQVATTRTNVAALAADLPRDLSALLQKHVAQEAEQTALNGRIKARRDQERADEVERERLRREIEELQRQRAERQARLTASESTRNHCQQAVAGALKALPEAWRTRAESAGLAGLHEWSNEKEQLQQGSVEALARGLEQARLGMEDLGRQVEGIERECTQVPAEAQRPLAEVQQQLREARQHYEVGDEAFRQAQQEQVKLATRKQQRETLQQQVLETERELKELVLLAQLLGRGRLQLYLVRQAERQIVDHANAVLDRLSGGQLFLRLRGSQDGESEADEALELEAYNRTTGQQPINVAFLSGSQRFRVAVCLALGIGQYASRQYRPIESVIIDEGFGCLDCQGRQVMIQELQNLRGQLHCILLVSHQEEFAEAFSDGYHFELADGTTKITRIQR